MASAICRLNGGSSLGLAEGGGAIVTPERLDEVLLVNMVFKRESIDMSDYL
jgi:hypothetical protein